LTEKIRMLEAELEAELAQRRAELRVGLEKGKAFFEEEILRRHRELRTRLSTYVLNARLLVILTAPVIYALIVPLVLLDLFVTIYQAVGFPVYGIPKARRRDYLVFDRHHLAYLNALEKLNCAYCSYANGLIAYVREIASRTEQYWCRKGNAQDHSDFMPANLTTLPNLSVSAVMCLPNSAGEVAKTVPPKSARRALILGSARPALISLLSLLMISTGVPFGNPMPVHPLAW
jgi:hypothetical protein